MALRFCVEGGPGLMRIVEGNFAALAVVELRCFERLLPGCQKLTFSSTATGVKLGEV